MVGTAAVIEGAPTDSERATGARVPPVPRRPARRRGLPRRAVPRRHRPRSPAASSASTSSSSCRATSSPSCCSATCSASAAIRFAPVLLPALPPPAARRVRRADRHRRSCTSAIASPVEVAERGRVVQGRVPVRHELVLHPPVDRLLRRRRRRATRCCSSGRSRSRSSSTSCGRWLLGGLAWCTRRLAPRRRHVVIPAIVAAVRARVGGVGAVDPQHRPQPRVLRHRRPRLPAAGRRAARAHARDHPVGTPLRTRGAGARRRVHRRADRARDVVDPSRRDRARRRGHAGHRGVPRRGRERRRTGWSRERCRTRRSSISAGSRTAPTCGTGSSSSSRHATFDLGTDDHRDRAPGVDRARVAQLPAARAADPALEAARPAPTGRDRRRPRDQRRRRARDRARGSSTPPTPSRSSRRATRPASRRTPALDWSAATENIAPFTNCYQQPVEKCTVVHGTTGPHLLLVGDSHAGMLIPALTEIATPERRDAVARHQGRLPVAAAALRDPGHRQRHDVAHRRTARRRRTTSTTGSSPS